MRAVATGCGVGKVHSRPVIRELIFQSSAQISGPPDARDLAAPLLTGTKLEIEAVAN
jgi:hypothetical protein